jgi:hypothetical protein
MNKKAWDAFSAARKRYKTWCGKLARGLPELQACQQALVDTRTGPAYVVETPVLYNFALDGLTQKDTIKLILVADNPGRREQAAENRRYLVGPSGKIAERFFREHPELGIDFRKNVLILNKTPIHTPRTVELRALGAPSRPGKTADSLVGGTAGGLAAAKAIAVSQRFMAELLLDFHRAFAPAPVWIIGYSEMKKGGIFEIYTDALKELYAGGAATPGTGKALRNRIFLYRHFSMNQFTVDLRRQSAPGEDLNAALERIGRAYRERILGW